MYENCFGENKKINVFVDVLVLVLVMSIIKNDFEESENIILTPISRLNKVVGNPLMRGEETNNYYGCNVPEFLVTILGNGVCKFSFNFF